MPTLQDVARIAGVSTATVSHVINNTRRVTPATAARVKNAIGQLNFVPNPVGRMLARHKTAPINSWPDVIDSTEANRAASEPGVDVSPKEAEPLKVISVASGETTRAMLRIVRAAQPISRADLARRLEVHRSTVTEMVKPLLV